MRKVCIHISRGTTPDFPREIRYVKVTSIRLNVIYLFVMYVYFIIIFLFLQNIVVDSIVYLLNLPLCLPLGYIIWVL